MSATDPDDTTVVTPDEILALKVASFASMRRNHGESQPEPEPWRVEMERELHQGRVRALRAKWNAPQRHVEFDALTKNRWPEWKSVYDSVLDKMGTTGVMIALIGERATGKTQLAVEIMKSCTGGLDGRRAMFDTAAGFYRALQSTFSKAATETADMVVRRYREPSLLIIDEIGKTSGTTPWEPAQLFELLNLRYGDCKDTIMTSNQNAEAFTATLGPSLARRMNETGGIITCNWV